MRKYALGITITATLIITSLLLLQKTDSSLFISNDRSTSGQIKNGMKLGTTHEIESLDGKVTVGDSKSNKIEPVVTLSKLDDSAYLKVNYPINSDQVETTENTITWKGKEQDLYFKQPTPDTFEFDLTLRKKPVSNVFEYNIDTQNLDFFYQPELTEEEKKEGHIRTDNIIGSYAVYYKEKTGLEKENNYKTGKAFHIYRPKIIDSVGNWIWGELLVDTQNNKLLVKVPEEFLETGTYPITVDPTFGYTSQGASDAPLCGAASDWQVAMRGDIDGTVTDVNAYIKYSGITPDQRYFTLRANSAGIPGSASYTSSLAAINSTSYTLHTVSSLSQAISNPYWVAAGCTEQTGSGTSSIAYDTGGTAGYGAATSDFGVWSNNSNRYSVYATYNTDPTPTPTPSPTPTPTPVFRGPNSPGTVVDDSSIGSIAWINPSNAVSSNNVYTTAESPGGGLTNTHYLKATNFGFSIPTGSTINGILVDFERKREAFFAAVDSAVRIVKSNGSIGTTNKSAGASWLTSEGYVSFGGTSDLWGETWTYSDINNSNFGVVISPQINMSPDGNPAYVDHIRITVYYTPPPGVNYKGSINLKGNVNLK